MNRPEWKDQSPYSRGDKERVPSVWVMQLTREVCISVVRSHVVNRENWVMHCEPWFNTYCLDLPSTVENRDEAMARAIALVRTKVNEVAAAMREVN